MIYNICVPGRRYTAVEGVGARVSIVLTVPGGYCRGGRVLAAAALLQCAPDRLLSEGGVIRHDRRGHCA
jgi:hypothetical protein